MIHIVSVDPVSGNLSAGVDVAREGALVGACPGAGNVQAREILERILRGKAVGHVVGVDIEPHRLSEEVIAERDCALVGAGARARSVVFAEPAVARGNALEAVKDVIVIMERSHDRPLRIDVEATGALVEACASARGTKCDDGDGCFERLLNHMQEVRHLLPSKAAVDS